MDKSESTHRTIDPFSREVLGFLAVLDLLHGYLSGPISEPLLDQAEPHTHLENWRGKPAATTSILTKGLSAAC